MSRRLAERLGDPAGPVAVDPAASAAAVEESRAEEAALAPWKALLGRGVQWGLGLLGPAGVAAAGLIEWLRRRERRKVYALIGGVNAVKEELQAEHPTTWTRYMEVAKKAFAALGLAVEIYRDYKQGEWRQATGG